MTEARTRIHAEPRLYGKDFLNNLNPGIQFLGGISGLNFRHVRITVEQWRWGISVGSSIYILAGRHDPLGETCFSLAGEWHISNFALSTPKLRGQLGFFVHNSSSSEVHGTCTGLLLRAIYGAGPYHLQAGEKSLLSGSVTEFGGDENLCLRKECTFLFLSDNYFYHSPHVFCNTFAIPKANRQPDRRKGGSFWSSEINVSFHLQYQNQPCHCPIASQVRDFSQYHVSQFINMDRIRAGHLKGKGCFSFTIFCDHYFQVDEGYQIISWCPWTKVGRIGEASNPGPTQDPGLMHVSLVNITKLRKNSDEVFELFQELPGIVCIAETSADERAIKQTTKQADKQRLNFFASAPCASSKLDPSAKSRPLYGGVGILTHRASRVPECQRSLDEWQSTRYLETIVKIGVTQVLVLTLYLHARDENFFLYKKDASDALLQRAIARISEWGGPAIIAGDFNQPPEDMCIWPALQAKGWTEAHRHAEEIIGTGTIPTYKEETRNDSLLVSPELGSSIVQIQVRSGFHFPQHKPITVTLQIEEIPRYTKVWKAPKPLTAPQIEAILPEEHDEFFVDVMCAEGLDTQSPGQVSLEQWSAAAESAINACLVRNEQAGLKPSQKGRGKAPVYKFSPLKCEPKFARSGDFAPPSGGTSVMAKQCTRQVRRLESIHRMLAKHDTLPNVVIENDWSAACRAKGFIPDFQTWAECVLPTYPTLEIIETLLEKTKTDQSE